MVTLILEKKNSERDFHILTCMCDGMNCEKSSLL